MLRRTLIISSLLGIAVAMPVQGAISSGERNALVALYQSTAGDGWIERDGWLGSPGTECQWYGVSCDENETTVVDLALWSNNLVGTIPRAINGLVNLQGIALAGNQLSGAIPTEFGQLIHLRRIELQENQLNGIIPTSFYNLASLEELWLFDNQISGSIAGRVGQLDAIRIIEIGNNMLSGELPDEIGDLSTLEYLGLAGNQLTGPIPAAMGDLNKLEYLNLEANQLSGPIPETLGDAIELRDLRLPSNQLSGSIPSNLGRLRNLEYLDLSINQLEGPIPTNVVGIANLKSVYLSSNDLTGPIPASIGDLINVESFSLSFNRLSGPIPPEVSRMTRVQYLEMAGNQLTGSIPSGITALTSLVYLDLSGNSLDGPIPSNLGMLTRLETLELSGNHLTGPIPPVLGSLQDLRWIGLAENRLSGAIPDTLANLTNLEWLSLFGNQLTGTVPTWLGSLSRLTGLLLGGNVLGGTIPSNLTNLENLETLDLCGNSLSGTIPSDIGRLSKLAYLSLCENDLSGPIPQGLWSLTNMIDMRLEYNQLTGSLPPEIGGMTRAEVLLLNQNQIEGEIPRQISGLQSVQVLSLDGNRLKGAIPPEIGDLSRLEFLGLEQNALRGAVPTALANLEGLDVDGLRLGFNSLFTNDQALRSFINLRHEGGPFEATQTLAPTGVSVSGVTDRSVIASWNPIPYIYDEGGYEVIATPVGGGTSTIVTTPSKELTTTAVRGLMASTSYSLVVRSTTHPHGFQQNFLRSDPSASVSFTTGARVASPALVDVVSLPGGLIQIGGAPTNTTSYTLANFGDVATDIMLDQTDSFFTQSPTSFTLAPGGSQVVTVASVPNQDPGSYWGSAFAVGDGVPEDLFVTVQLLAVASPGGQAVARAETSRIELAGQIGVDAIGTVTFRNVGTANLAGILVSDQSWIETPPELIEIPVNEFRNINFDVRRSKRPDAGLGIGGTLFGTIRLVYLDASGLSASGFDASDGGVTQTLVTVVDTTRPPVEEFSIPPLGPGELYRFIPGAIESATTSTDFFIANAFGVRSLFNAEVYFVPEGGAQASVATIGELAPNQTLALASVVSSVFEKGSAQGSLVVRTPNLDQQSAVMSVRYTHPSNLRDTVPVFRSDRGASAGDVIYLAGVENSADDLTTLHVQEVGGGTATVLVDAYDLAGRIVQADLEIGPLGPFETAKTTVLPKGAVVMVVKISEQSTGSVVAWAHVSNRTTESGPAVVDWGKQRGFEWSESTRIPVVIREGEGPARRRPVRRVGSAKSRPEGEAQSESGLATRVVLFNPDDSVAVAKLTLRESGGNREKSVTLMGKETRLIDDLAGWFKGGAARTTGSVILDPVIGRVIVSANLEDVADRDLLTPIPVFAAGSGLRLGQSRTFAGLEDSRQSTVAAATRGTLRTSFGIAEIAGESITVRATLLVFDGRSLAGTLVSRDFSVGANQLLVVDDMARSIIGSQRETLFGDMRNLQLELRVVDGDGAANVFVLSRDNGTNDPLLLME